MLSKYAGQPWSSISVLLPGVIESMSTHIVLSLLLFFSASPHQVLDANPQTSETEQFGTWGYSLCTCVCMPGCVCVCWPTFTQGERVREVELWKFFPLPSFALPPLTLPPCPCIQGMQRWLWQHCSSEQIRLLTLAPFFFLPFLSVFLHFFSSLLFVSSRLCHGCASRCCLYNYKDPYLLIYLVCLHWDFAQQ